MANDNGAPDKSAFSSENVLNRLSAARAQASKEANRLFLAALIFGGLFLVKASGLRIDLTLLETNVAKVPYGLFFYLVASQISMILSFIRSADSTAIDSRLRAAIKSFGVSNVDDSERTFVNEFEWFSVAASEFESKKSGPVAKTFYTVTSLLTALTAISFYVFPSAAGIYTIYNHQSMINLGNVQIQYWILLSTTSLSILWFLNFIAMWSVMRRNRGD